MEDEIKNCIGALQRGGTILYPTDTIWGIGCDATNPEAVSIIYRLKQRMERKSMIILLDEPERLRDYISAIPETAFDLIRDSKTPLTIIYPEAKNLAENVVAEDGSVAIRIVKTDFCRRLIHEFGKPIVSTSANISGEGSPISFRDIVQEIIRGVDYVVDESLNDSHEPKPSRIIKLDPDGKFTIIRT
ncbi:MAG: L-threonylcarbamoyladenylate synthase [Bacteroidales bacterium]|nr:L-threonylcarbamoyladenylate synthase [Bacteroidales bacterium]